MSRPEPSSTTTELSTIPSTSLQRVPQASADEPGPAATSLRRPIELIVRFSDGQEYVIEPESDVEWQLDLETDLPRIPYGTSSAGEFARRPLKQTFLLSISGRVASAIVGHVTHVRSRRLTDGG